MDLYQQYIHISRYSRWRDDLERRETWTETVQRYIDYFDKKTGYAHTTDLNGKVKNAILNLEVMPSMRALMTAGDALERENLAGFNCFSGDTLYITESGLKTFKDTVGTYQNVLAGDGMWRSAEVKSFGIQKIQTVVLRPGSRSRTQLRIEIKVTPDHRWITGRGEVTDLKVGDTIPFNQAVAPEFSATDFIAGLGFGDGSLDTRGRARIRLCGEKAKYLHLFESFGNCSIMHPPSCNGDPVVVFHKGFFESWKRLPANPTYWWLHGYMAADGHANPIQPGLSTQDLEAANYVGAHSAYAGFALTGWNELTGPTNYGPRAAPLIRLGLRDELDFRVVDIIDSGVTEEVFCVTEPVTGLFTLAGGVLTGNCSYLAVNTKRSFSEALYILMCGTGVGFSCERQEVAKLPVIPETITKCDDTIIVADSKEGWAKAFSRLLSALWEGDIPVVDYSRIRKAGERLKVFGGRASGPEPLRKLFNFTVEQFKKAKGRKLNSLEVHDLMCMVGEIVVVGGVRRSALISLSNLSDQRMRDAKSGQWWVDNPQRGLANNSVAFTEKPSAEIFIEEWLSLIKSKSGERGIFNRCASAKQAERWGRRPKDVAWGTNPCCLHPDTLLMTTDGPRKIRDLQGLPFTAVVDGELYDAPRGSWISGLGKTLTLKTEEGYELTLTPEHQIKTWLDGWKPAGTLKAGDKIQIGNHRRGFNSWSGEGTYGEGYLLGMFVGDGNFSTQSTSGNWGAHVKVWGSDTDSLLAPALDFANTLPHRTDWKGWVFVDPYHQMSINGLPQKYGIQHSTKCEVQHLETLSSEFQKAFVRGLFDTDGHVEGQSTKGGVSVRLASVNYGLLQVVQRMLLRFGVRSKIKLQKQAGQTLLPDGKGGQALFDCKACYRLIISSDTSLFSERIGFFHKEKQSKLDKLLEGCVRGSYSKPYTATVKELVGGPELEVWDAEVSGIHAFDANGIYAHNSEIILQDKQLCNLSEVIIREHDTLETLLKKVEIATILGTMQSMLTKFGFVSEKWSQNTAGEALLGVSLTGIMDNELMAGSNGHNTLKLALNQLRDHAREVNAHWSEMLGIRPSAAITCVKPSGCTGLDTEIKTADGNIISMATLFEASGHGSVESLATLPPQTWITPAFKTMVLDEDNQEQEITKLFVNGMQPVYDIEFEDGKSYRFTGNHKLKTLTGWKRVDELTEQDEVVSY